MGKIYLNQTALTIILDTYISLASVSAARIYYKKPSGESNYWTATKSGTVLSSHVGVPTDPDSPSNTYDIDEVGNWKLWAWVQFEDGSRAIGEPTSLRVYS